MVLLSLPSFKLQYMPLNICGWNIKEGSVGERSFPWQWSSVKLPVNPRNLWIVTAPDEASLIFYESSERRGPLLFWDVFTQESPRECIIHRWYTQLYPPPNKHSIGGTSPFTLWKCYVHITWWGHHIINIYLHELFVSIYNVLYCIWYIKNYL